MRRIASRGSSPGARSQQLSVPILAIAAIAALPTLSACAGDADRSSSWTITVDTLESGVVRVVNTPAASVEPGYVIEEELRIGTMDGEGPDQFGQIKGLAVLSDGRMAVLDALAREVRVFGREGGHLATWGRQGAGPGEFESPWGLMRDDRDRLWVPDSRNRRMTVLDPDSGLVATYDFPVMLYGFVWGGAMLDDGRIVKPSITLGPPERRQLLRIYGPAMTLVDSILAPEEPPRAMDADDHPGSFVREGPDGRPMGFMSVPYYPRAQRHMAHTGDIWLSEGGEPVYRLARTDLRGDTTLVVETRRPLVPVPDSVRDGTIARLRERMERMDWGTGHDWSKVPRVYPPVTQLFVVDDGELWVRTASADSLQVFDVYRPDGRHDRTVATSLPMPPFLPPVVRGDRVWAVVQDEMQVPYVVRARIRARATDAAP